MNDVGMDLLEEEQGGVLSAESRLEQAAIFLHRFAGIPFHEAEIQNFLFLEDAFPTGTRAEAVDKPGNSRKGH